MSSKNTTSDAQTEAFKEAAALWNKASDTADKQERQEVWRQYEQASTTANRLSR